MRRGTTPTFTITVNADCDISQAETLEVYLKQRPTVLVITNPEVLDAHTVRFSLTQQQTLMFDDGSIQLQIRVLMPDKTVWATDISNVGVEEILKSSVIGDETNG